MTISTLYHATRLSDLPSIMTHGLERHRHGAIHGKMDYAPPEKAVYLATNEHSNNLNTNLFSGCEKDDDVIVLEIDAAHLKPECYFPDDAFFYMLDEDFCEEGSDLSKKELTEFLSENAPNFCVQFGLDAMKGLKLLKAFCQANGTMEEYAPIARQMGIEYLHAQGETAYLGDICPAAIKGWHYHPDSTGPRLTAENTFPDKQYATQKTQRAFKSSP